MTDLVERIETTRHLGAEFLTWLWFKSELFEGSLERPDKSGLELWLDAQMLLQSTADKNERTVLRGIAPSATPEAKLALTRNKLPLRARVCITHDNQEFTLVFDANSFSFGSVALPQVLLEDSDEAFVERMRLLELLDDIWGELYAEFLSLRATSIWPEELVPALEAWANGKDGMTARGYRGLVQRARR